MLQPGGLSICLLRLGVSLVAVNFGWWLRYSELCRATITPSMMERLVSRIMEQLGWEGSGSPCSKQGQPWVQTRLLRDLSNWVLKNLPGQRLTMQPFGAACSAASLSLQWKSFSLYLVGKLGKRLPVIHLPYPTMNSLAPSFQLPPCRRQTTPVKLSDISCWKKPRLPHPVLTRQVLLPRSS